MAGAEDRVDPGGGHPGRLQRLGPGAGSSVPAVVGITGSVGKTTTREMIAAALAGFQVYKTPGNKNSQVGVPITMWEIAPRTRSQ